MYLRLVAYTIIMSRSLPLRPLAILIAIGIIGFVIAMMLGLANSAPPPPLTAIADTEPVRRLVSVSGVVESEQTARLQFPLNGVVRAVPVRIGSEVAAGDTLATLTIATLEADRLEAQAALDTAIANRDELFAGVTSAARDVSTETIRAATLALDRVRAEQTQLIENARQTLLSSGLIARAVDPNERSLPPVVTGTYTCTDTGTYRVEVFGSNADSGFSFRLSGLEQGVYEVATNQPATFGSCGLSLRFTPGDRFAGSRWEIIIPNQDNPQFITNQNAYQQIQITAESRIRLAEQELALAEATARNVTAPARAEAVARANAAIAQATARLNRIDALIEERTLRAPFAGTITAVDVQVGETASAGSGITLVATADFTLVARIPEIDVSAIAVGQRAEVIFDANPTAPQAGTITYVAPTAVFINGVAFFEVRITLDEMPPWLRDGLNADVDIITAEAQEDIVRVPSRAIAFTDNLPFVTIITGQERRQHTVEIVLTGNDGFTALTGITPGSLVLLP